MDIKISMTEFVNFVNSSGMSKMTIVQNAKMKHEEEEKILSTIGVTLRMKWKNSWKGKERRKVLKNLPKR